MAFDLEKFADKMDTKMDTIITDVQEVKVNQAVSAQWREDHIKEHDTQKETCDRRADGIEGDVDSVRGDVRNQKYIVWVVAGLMTGVAAVLKFA